MNGSFQDKRALITGASAGIGAEFARQLAASGANLVLVARREDRLDALSQEIQSEHAVEVKTIALDLADAEAGDALREACPPDSVDILINNAGYALKSTMTRVPWQDLADQIQVMLTSLTQLCHIYVPHMVEHGYGRVINVASLAAFAPDFAGSLYTPIKAYVLRFSRSLSLEVRGTGVNVMALCPGYTYSEFHDVQGTRASVSKLPRLMWMKSEPVVRQGLRAVDRGKHTHINGLVNRSLAGLCTILPHGLIHRSAPARKLGRRRPPLRSKTSPQGSSGERK